MSCFGTVCQPHPDVVTSPSHCLIVAFDKPQRLGKEQEKGPRMADYSELAQLIVDGVGGKDNIESITNCITRLRFVLRDESIARDELFQQGSADKISGVTGLVKQGGQYQVVIGTHVGEVAKPVKELVGETAPAKAPEKPKGLGATILDYITAIFMPCLNILCACGMVKGLNALFAFLGLYGMESGIYMLVNGIGDCLFVFFPVFLALTCAKKLDMSPFLGVAIACAMIYPDLQGVDLGFGGFTVNATYTSTVLPIIFVMFLAKPINDFCETHLPTIVKSFLSPMITLTVSAALGFVIIGPVMNALAGAISGALGTVAAVSPVLAGIVIGGLYPLLVVAGIHGPIVMMGIMNVMTTGSDFLMALIGLQMFATAGVVIAMAIRTKDATVREACAPAVISALFGVTEPAIYGITLPKVKPFVYTCIASACGGLVLGITGAKVYQLAGMGLFSLPGFLGGENMTGNLVNACIGYGVALIAGLAIGLALYQDEQ